MALITAAGAFYIPASAMMFLYAKVYLTIAKRKNTLQNAVVTNALKKFSRAADTKSGPLPVITKVTDDPESKETEISEGPSQISDDAEKTKTTNSPRPVSLWGKLKQPANDNSDRNNGNVTNGKAGTPTRQPVVNTKPQYGRQLKSLKKESRATRLLAAIIFVFISLWAPYNILVVYSTFDHKVPPLAWNLSYWLCYLNSTLNPVCYAACNPTFRSAFKAILTCSKREAK